MRRALMYISIIIMIGLGSWISSYADAPEFEPSPYVYKITAWECTGGVERRTLTGFRVNTFPGIVTALHGVLGCQSIMARTDEGDGPFRGLTIAEVDIDRDTALLWSKELNRTRGRGLVAINNPLLTDYEALHALGYPKDIGSQRPTIGVEVVDKTILLKLLPEDLIPVFAERDSPALDVDVLSLQTHLVPGHSGAPILNGREQVIAVANGGLDSGRVEMSWAIPWGEIELQPVSEQDVVRLSALANSGLSLSGFYEPGSLVVNPPSTPTSSPTYTPSPPTATPTVAPSPTPAIPAPGEVRKFAGISFVFVPSGEFRMGSNDQEVQRAIDLCRSYPNDGGGDCSTKFEDERPTRPVHTNAYWIMRTEVTNDQFAEFVNAGGYLDTRYWSSEGWSWRSQEGITEPGYWRNDAVNQANYPVVGISWFETEAYVNWLQQQTGIPVRLPTEEEWEKAARGTDGRLFPWGDSWSYGRANFCDSRCTLYEWADQNTDDGYAYTAPVGSYPGGASPYGALDMSGNVWEWVANRARKGGSWTNDPEVLRTPERLQDERYTRPKNVEFPSKAGTGFRLAITYTLGQ